MNGKLNIPAMIAKLPTTIVVRWVKLFGVILSESDFNFLSLASIIIPIPIINIQRDSIYALILKLKMVWLIIPINPKILTIDNILINLDDTLTFPSTAFFMIILGMIVI